ncbi:LLM class flavin-dependent oxidoreductase [Tepidiforma flava]|uniref:LLM class flavin-dependent oxidoreductase n=1 Tax=Tepidiforma flava TaxID=3004094 RepID=A0ABY7M4T2_9CHLR|nr:LLM class flavin-dependent oxidoreductase [Tepidiforma flava]WBL35572.1 LLM class flavin-dependent oxidoreductase [Tepidiforma flava]
MADLALSVLDQSPVRRGGSPAEAIRETLELARLCDRLGYRRYWLAEHHSAGSLASAAPEVLIARVASLTSGIRVGSGGVMLPHYAPLKVAEQFRMLEALFPGRVDLGIGRAPGSDTRTARALGGGAITGLEAYPQQLADLEGFLAGELPAGHPYRGVTAQPAGPAMPELWLLGSSGVSAALAAERGWAFCFAHFITEEGAAETLRRYSAGFRPSRWLERPRPALAVAVTCAETDEEAEHLSWSRWGARIISRARPGEPPGIPSPRDAMAFDYTEAELDYLAYLRQSSIYGSPGAVGSRLRQLAAESGAEELVIVTITYDAAARKRSYELLAREFGLAPRHG